MKKEVIVYTLGTYYITEGRSSVFEGIWDLRKNGIFVEYPDEEVLALTKKEKVNIKKTIVNYCKELRKIANKQKNLAPKKSEKHIHFKFGSL